MGPDWANLPAEVVGLISERLTLDRDYFLFGMVCKSWHRKTKNNAVRISTTSTRHRAPMLLFSTGNNGVWRLYDVMRDKVLDLQLKLSKKRFCGSSKGWLIAVEEDFTITLINPVFRVKGRKVKENSIIRLPPFNPPSWEHVCIWRPNYGVYKATITADPILDADNCVVLVIYEDRCQLAFIRLNKDNVWTYIEDLSFVLFEVVPVRNQFYAIGGDQSQLLSFDITARSSSDIKFITTRKPDEYFTRLYLVSVNEEELLMVARYIDHDYDREKRVTKKFEIFKLDYLKREWIEKKSLGDVALLLGDNSTVAVLASNIPGCRSNCIYFTHDEDRQSTIEFGGRGPHDLGVYDLESGIVDPQRPFTFSKLAMEMVSKWMLSKGQGRTMGTYFTLLTALAEDGRIEEAEELWTKLFSQYLESMPRMFFDKMISIYYQHGLHDKMFEIFADMEELGVQPNVSIVTKVGNVFKELDMLDKYNKLKKKYPPPKWEYRYINGKRVKVRANYQNRSDDAAKMLSEGKETVRGSEEMLEPESNPNEHIVEDEEVNRNSDELLEEGETSSDEPSVQSRNSFSPVR